MMFQRLGRIAAVAIATIGLCACAGGGGTGFNNGPETQPQSGGAMVPQSVAAPALQTVGAQALHADAPPPFYLPASIHEINSRLLTSPIVDDIGSFPGGPIIEGENTGSNGTGVEGIAAGIGNGVVGVTKSTGDALYGNGGSNGSGVYGYSVGKYGVVGNSTNFIGVIGETTSATEFGGLFTTSSTSASAIALKGLTPDGIGVEGLVSAGGSGAYGVYGESDNGAGIGVKGSSLNGYGAEGVSNGGIGVYASSGTGYGIYSLTFGGDAIHAEDDSGGTGITVSTSGGGTGLQVEGSEIGIESQTGGGSCSGPACLAFYGTNSVGNGADISGNYIGLVARAPSGTGTFPFDLTDESGHTLFYVDGNGDVYYHGSLNTFAALRNGHAAIAYAPKSAAPSIEDSGTARLSNGSATVALDPTFAQSIDPQRTYQVMLTPDSDTRGLFVASKSHGSFVVREVQGGRGSFDFDYHIYASPLGHANERMALTSRIGPNAPIAALPRAGVRKRVLLKQR